MKKQKGFTLAEVLITLGIIGVVAGITIPNLMTQIQDRQFKEAAKKAFSITAQVITQLKNDNGENLVNYYSDATLIKQDFSKYFKVAKDCGMVSDGTSCVPYFSSDGGSNPYNYKTLLGNPSHTWIMGGWQFVSADGMFYGFGNDGSHFAITVDVNGYQKGPNVFGRDVFIFEVLNDVLVPMGKQGTWYSYPITYCRRANDHVYNGYTCMYYVIQGIDY